MPVDASLVPSWLFPTVSSSTKDVSDPNGRSHHDAALDANNGMSALQASALQNTFEGSGCLRQLPTRGEVRRAYCSPSGQRASRGVTADTPPRTAASAFPGLGAGLAGLEPPRTAELGDPTEVSRILGEGSGAAVGLGGGAPAVSPRHVFALRGKLLSLGASPPQQSALAAAVTSDVSYLADRLGHGSSLAVSPRGRHRHQHPPRTADTSGGQSGASAVRPSTRVGALGPRGAHAAAAALVAAAAAPASASGPSGGGDAGESSEGGGASMLPAPSSRAAAIATAARLRSAISALEAEAAAETRRLLAQARAASPVAAAGCGAAGGGGGGGGAASARGGSSRSGTTPRPRQPSPLSPRPAAVMVGTASAAGSGSGSSGAAGSSSGGGLGRGGASEEGASRAARAAAEQRSAAEQAALDAALGEVAVQVHTHCAERGALLEWLRQRQARLVATLQAQIGEMTRERDRAGAEAAEVTPPPPSLPRARARHA